MIEELVFVIGAGASKDALYPLYTDLLSSTYIKDLRTAVKNASLESILDDELSELHKECLHFAEAGLHFEELLYTLERDYPEEYERAIRYYMRLLGVAGSLTGFTFYSAPYRYEYLNEFARFILDVDVEHVSILSFNHDFLIEAALYTVQKLRNQSKQPFTYDVKRDNFRLWGLGGMPDLMNNEVAKKITIYKLHGSMNWLICPNCGFIIMGDDEIALFSLRTDKLREILTCEKCGVVMRAAIIAPKRVKDYALFEYQWQRASEHLRAAQIIFFVGYSMPDYDAEAEQLFKSSLPHNANVVVVNPSRAVEFRKKFRQLPGSRHAGAPYSFSQFMQGLGKFGINLPGEDL